MPNISRLGSLHDTFITNWLCAILFSLATGIEDADKIIEVVSSSDYLPVYNGVYELVSSPYQTPSSLLYMIVFATRLHSESGSGLLEPADFGVAQAVDKYLLVLRVFYLLALEVMREVVLSEVEQLDIAHLAYFPEYERIREFVRDEITSPHTGILELGHREWNDYLVDIYRLTVLMPYDGAALKDMQIATIDDLLTFMQYDVKMGKVSLKDLVFSSFPQHSWDAHPAHLSTFALGCNISPNCVYSKSLYFPGTPSSTSSLIPSEWNPSADPIVESGRCRTRNVAPGSVQAVYDLDGIASKPMSLVRLVHDFGVLTIRQPRPKRAIDVQVIELEAQVLMRSL